MWPLLLSKSASKHRTLCISNFLVKASQMKLLFDPRHPLDWFPSLSPRHTCTGSECQCCEFSAEMFTLLSGTR